MTYTPYSYRVYSGDGSKVTFDVPFPYIKRAHVEITRVNKQTQAETKLTYLDSGVPTGDEYVWKDDNEITVGTAPTTEQSLRVQRDTPENQQIVQWVDGSYIVSYDLNQSDTQWLYGLQELEDKMQALTAVSIKYLGGIDLTADPAPVNSQSGDFFINTGSGVVLNSWTGIAGDAVVGSEQCIFNGNTSEWEIFQVPSTQSGVLEVKVSDPITRDLTDIQRPIIGIKASSPTQDGSMSKEDKEKLDALPGATTGINLGYTAAPTSGTVTNTAGSDATIPFATAGDAGLFIEAATPGSGTVQYARQVTDAGAATWAQVAIPPGTIIDNTEPPTPADGQLWYRPSNSTLWVWDNGNSTWQPAMAPVPTGGGADYANGNLPNQVFLENETTCTADYQLTAGRNALSAGPITVNDGVTVTIPNQQNWVIV